MGCFLSQASPLGLPTVPCVITARLFPFFFYLGPHAATAFPYTINHAWLPGSAGESLLISPLPSRLAPPPLCLRCFPAGPYGIFQSPGPPQLSGVRDARISATDILTQLPPAVDTLWVLIFLLSLFFCVSIDVPFLICLALFCAGLARAPPRGAHFVWATCVTLHERLAPRLALSFTSRGCRAAPGGCNGTLFFFLSSFFGGTCRGPFFQFSRALFRVHESSLASGSSTPMLVRRFLHWTSGQFPAPPETRFQVSADQTCFYSLFAEPFPLSSFNKGSHPLVHS